MRGRRSSKLNKRSLKTPTCSRPPQFPKRRPFFLPLVLRSLALSYPTTFSSLPLFSSLFHPSYVFLLGGIWVHESKVAIGLATHPVPLNPRSLHLGLILKRRESEEVGKRPQALLSDAVVPFAFSSLSRNVPHSSPIAPFFPRPLRTKVPSSGKKRPENGGKNRGGKRGRQRMLSG